MSSALVIAITVAFAVVALRIALGVAVVLIALVVLGAIRQRQKRSTERRSNARQLSTGAAERAERAEHDRDSAEERAGARGIDPDR